MKIIVDDKLTILSIDCEVEGVKETQFLAMSEGECVGRVGVKAEGLQVATMRQLFVAESHRGQGIGRTLVAECVRKARQAGCLTLNLTVAKCNRQIVSFYNPLGFIAAVEFEDEELVMVMPLCVIRRIDSTASDSDLLESLNELYGFIAGFLRDAPEEAPLKVRRAMERARKRLGKAQEEVPA